MAFNPLSLLLGQQMSSLIDPDELPPEENTITVTAPQGRPEASMPNFSDPPAREQSQSRYVLNDDRIAPRPEELKEILPRRGMFGMKGTLRDVLGTLGDAFLVQSGNKTVYAPQRQMEREGDAMFGAAQDPLQAAERLAAAGDVEGARQLIEQTQQNEYRQSQLSSLEGNRKDQQRDRAFDRKEVGLDRVLRWTAGGLPYQQIAAGAAQYGLTPEDLASIGITPEMSGEQRLQVGAGDVRVNQTQTLPLRERQLDISQQNADSARISATRPRNPPPRPRSDTAIEYLQQLIDTPEDERTPEEKAWIRRQTEGTGRRRRIGNAPPPPTSSTARKFRVLNR